MTHGKSWMVMLFLSATFLTAHTQDNFCKIWYTRERESKVQIYLAEDGKYYGRIIWLKDAYKNGKPRIDNENPDASKRGQTLLGLVIITGLQKKSETEYVGGKIYDPTRGTYYSCKMTMQDNGTLSLRGYILGMPFLGRSTQWFPDDEPLPEPQKITPPAPETATGKIKSNP